MTEKITVAQAAKIKKCSRNNIRQIMGREKFAWTKETDLSGSVIYMIDKESFENYLKKKGE